MTHKEIDELAAKLAKINRRKILDTDEEITISNAIMVLLSRNDMPFTLLIKRLNGFIEFIKTPEKKACIEGTIEILQEALDMTDEKNRWKL